MTDPRLPQAQFFELPAPPDGEAVAVRGGRSIRRRRRMVGTSAAALSMLLVAGVVVAAGPGSDHASDQLVPAVPDVHAPSVLVSPSPARAATVAAGRPPAAGAVAGPAGDGPTAGPSPATAGVDGTQAHRSDSTSGGASRPSYVTPALRRTFIPASPTGARVCGAHTTSTGTDVHGRLDWCLLVVATATERGHDLSISVCRDQTGDARLNFSTNQEVDLAVSRSGHVVWRWSTGHASSRQPHALSTPAGACWTWTAPWTDVDASGRPLPSGDYSLTVTSRASEVAGLPDETGTFRIH